MTSNGLDFAWSKPRVVDIKGGGYVFVCRYHSYDDSGKNLTKAEADSYRNNGIGVVSNWEYSTTAALNGYNQGVTDAKAAVQQVAECGGPSNAVIYFSCDWDASDAQKPTIGQYFKGVASVIGLARTGAYGSYWVIKYLFDNKLITWGWQTYAWSGGLWDTRAQLRQVQNGIKVGGADVDKNTAQVAVFGQWGATAASTYDEELMTAQADVSYIKEVVTKIGSADGTYYLTQHIDAATKQAKAATDAVASVAAKVDELASKVEAQTPVAPEIDYAKLATALLTAIKNGE